LFDVKLDGRPAGNQLVEAANPANLESKEVWQDLQTVILTIQLTCFGKENDRNQK